MNQRPTPGNEPAARTLFALALMIAISGQVPVATASDARQQSPHFRDGIFHNLEGVPGKTFWQFLKVRATTSWAKWPERVDQPSFPPPAERVTGNDLHVTLVNHATVLIQGNGYNILTDPIYAERCSPVSFAGPKRVIDPGVRFADLPPIDAIVISHDHYDHLDLETLGLLIERDAPRIYAGLGVGERLEGVGVVTEMDWWDSDTPAPGLTIDFVPVQHFSGRGLFDRSTTLWGGYVLRLGERLVYFGGDSGYAGHYVETRRRFGPVDVALLPIGAYAPRAFMGPMHLDPGEAVQAHIDLDATASIGIHYGTFQLTAEPIGEPAELLRAARREAAIEAEEFLLLPFGKTHVFSGDRG